MTRTAVTHRTEGLEAMDEILVMHGGRVLHRGAPGAVLPRATADASRPVPA
ncbi:hypothetical protein ACFYOV_01720 [Streptomyces sp. NPDC005931]|uniref:hypothetical protein n=1 Tax=Streptomyces sp. NPDC005931 TaxID=3364737 RepID=UPI00367588E6